MGEVLHTTTPAPRNRFAKTLYGSKKAAVDDLNYHALLVRGHFIVARQAQAAVEDVGADIGRGAGDVGVRTGAAASHGGNESMVTVDWLEMHGLPDRSAFGVKSGKRIQNFLWAGFAGLGRIQIIPVAADHGGHRVSVNNQAAQPEIGDAVLGIIRVQADR